VAFALALTLMISVMPATLLSAQTKQSSKSKKRPPAAPKPTPAPDFSTQRTKVAEQINIVTRFIFVYGKIANTFEVASDLAKKNQASPEVIAKNQQQRDALVGNISNLKAGIDDLTRQLQNDSRLQIQYLKMTGAADAIASAQVAVAAGRVEDGGKALVLSVEKLTDALMSLR